MDPNGTYEEMEGNHQAQLLLPPIHTSSASPVERASEPFVRSYSAAASVDIFSSGGKSGEVRQNEGFHQ